MTRWLALLLLLSSTSACAQQPPRASILVEGPLQDQAKPRPADPHRIEEIQNEVKGAQDRVHSLMPPQQRGDWP